MSKIQELHQSTQESKKSSNYDDYIQYVTENVDPETATSLLTDYRISQDYPDWRAVVEHCKNYAITNHAFEEYLRSTGLPPLFHKATHMDWPKKVWEKANGSSSLFLSGKPGTGKTHMAASVITETFLQFIPRPTYSEKRYRWTTTKLPIPRFTTIPQLLMYFRSTFKAEGESEMTVLRQYLEPRLTVFDDLGSEKVSEWSLQMLYMIIDYRYTNILPTIITSNLTLEEIGSTLSDRIASRIAGMCETISLKGDDRRIKRKP
jgi:DNA replication protein DnaC